jgi:hypothetical protein
MLAAAQSLATFLRRGVRFYGAAFRSSLSTSHGRWLWGILVVKLAIIFLVFKLLFFPDLLQRNYSTDEERAAAVRESLLSPT